MNVLGLISQLIGIKTLRLTSLNRRAARDVLGKVWRIGSEFKAMEVGNNIFHF